MRTTKTIQAEIEALRREWLDAEKAEFAATWTLEVLMARRAGWNAAVAHRAPKTTKDVAELQREIGYTLSDIKRAKILHGVA